MMPGPSYRLESTPHCPHCNHLLNGAFCVDGDRTPGEGDWTVCAECAAPLRFTAGHGLRKATRKDVMEMSPDEAEQVAKAMMAVRRLRGVPR